MFAQHNLSSNLTLVVFRYGTFIFRIFTDICAIATFNYNIMSFGQNVHRHEHISYQLSLHMKDWIYTIFMYIVFKSFTSLGRNGSKLRWTTQFHFRQIIQIWCNYKVLSHDSVPSHSFKRIANQKLRVTNKLVYLSARGYKVSSFHGERNSTIGEIIFKKIL